MSYKYTYDTEFFDFVTTSSGKSARLFLDRFIDVVFAGVRPQSVLDVGCGRGVWPADWRRRGTATVLGVDGTYIDEASLLIPPDCFHAADVSQPLDLGRTFELVECMEVAEHVPEVHADTLVASLVRHSDIVLFSAAVPGQGGEFHVNEQPYEYWRAKFAECGYEVYDAIRPSLARLTEVEPWYRYNAFVFASGKGARRLAPSAMASHVPTGASLVDVSPLWWRVRCAAIATLPATISTRLARLKHRASNLAHRDR